MIRCACTQLTFADFPVPALLARGPVVRETRPGWAELVRQARTGRDRGGQAELKGPPRWTDAQLQGQDAISRRNDCRVARCTMSHAVQLSGENRAAPRRRLGARNRIALGALAVLLGMLPSFLSAWRSNTYGPASYTTDTSDGLTFRVAAELLLDDRSPYDTAAHEDHIARTRLNGERPPYTLPFAYPPNALPLFLVYLVGPPRVAYLLFVLIGTTAMLAAAWVFSGLVIRNTFTRFALVVAIGCGGAALFNGQRGQTGSFLAASVFAYAAFYRRRPLAAGLALGLMRSSRNMPWQWGLSRWSNGAGKSF